MKRTLSTIAVAVLFLAMLTATSKKKRPPEHQPPSPRDVPPTAGWTRNEAGGVTFLSPPNAVVDRETMHVKMPSGVDVELRTLAINFDTERAAYKQDGEYTYGYLLDAPDAIVAVRWVPEPMGEFCEVSACSAGNKRCVYRAGLGDRVKLTTEECMAIVAMVRSVQ